ncbi:hypothetical protein CTAYLR_000703 [Chrysophaeum taylorii]|uniref:50S ribosomal protein L25 n=1 Tax=Chrysophaeum taylorii TaxID=2483200 RepID=A0AAD7UB26_9STRA|nr:hypothetical protein CTAYLR_000703 [Chrysophaeum taylorii]
MMRRVLVAEARSVAGTRQSQALRLAGRIPGVLYGVGEDGARDSRLLTVCRKDLMREIRAHQTSVENTLYDLELNGETSRVLMRQIQMRAASDYVVNVNFLRFSRGMVVQFPLKFVDEDSNVVLKRGGYLHREKHFVKCQVHTDDLPPVISFSIGQAPKNHVFRLHDLVLPDGLTLKAKRLDAPIAVIKTF